MEFKVNRGDVFLADLDPVVGSEQGGVRPVIVIQNNLGNVNGATTIVAACLTSREKSDIPTHVVIPGEVLGLEEQNTVLLEQIRTIDKSRLIMKFSPGPMEQYMPRLERALAMSFGFYHMLREEYKK